MVLKQLGRGSYGSAFKARRIGSTVDVVIKAVPFSDLSAVERADANREVTVLNKLCHPYIVRLEGHFIDNSNLCMVLEFADGGDLAARILQIRKLHSFFTEAQISRWFAQLLLGLSYMHSKNIMHRDLKPQNIFISLKDDKVLIGDYGTCKMLATKHSMAQTTTGTPYYMSPEIFQNRPYSTKSDIWALGCILFELCALVVPFDAPDVRSLSRRVTMGSNPPFPIRYSSHIKGIFLESVQRDYRSRPSADELLNRVYIKPVVDALILESEASARTITTTSSFRGKSPMHTVCHSSKPPVSVVTKSRSVSPGIRSQSKIPPKVTPRTPPVTSRVLKEPRNARPLITPPRVQGSPGRRPSPSRQRCLTRLGSPRYYRSPLQDLPISNGQKAPVIATSARNLQQRSVSPRRDLSVYPQSPSKQRIKLS